MKNIIKTGTLLAILFTAGACEEFLDVQPQDAIVAENYYTSESAIRQNTASLYSAKTWSNFQLGFMWMAGDELSGDLFYYYDQEGQFYYASFGANNSYLTQGWQGLYRVISFCNNIITTMPDAARNNSVSEDAIQQGLGEARCIRAIAYYFLTEYWGDVTIVENNRELMNTPLYRHTQASVYEFMRRDLVFAANILPATDSEAGRVTRWTAYGMLAKLHLTMASHLTDSQSAENFGKAGEYAQKVIEESGLSLYPDYSTLFDIEANNCEESLFAIENMVAGYGYGNSRNSHWSRNTYVSDIAWGDGKGPTLSLQESYDAADLRRKWVFMTLGDYYPNINKAAGGYTYNLVRRDANGVVLEGANEMLAHLKKYVIGKSADTNGGVGDSQDAANNTYILRLADVYLTYVEACIGNGTQTDNALALQVFNKIHHNRAGLSEKTDAITYDQLILERRCEFALEGINFFDVKRMFYRNQDKALSYLNKMERHRAYYGKNVNQSNENTRAAYVLNDTYTPITVTAGQMYLPVPGSEITASPTLAEEPVSYY